MSQGDAILAYRPPMRVKLICLPAQVIIAPDRPAGEGPEALFAGLDGNRIATFSGRADFTITPLQADHEHGHEVEAQLEARGLTKPALRQMLWNRRGFPGTAAQQQADCDNGVHGAPGTQQNWMNLPVEIIAESVRCAIEGPVGPPGTSTGNPGRTMDWGRTIQHAAEIAWWQQIVEDRVIKLFISPDLAVPLDANGDTTKPNGQVVSIPTGTLSPGVVTQGFANRIGFAGSEAVIGTATFVVDTGGTYGRLHVRGAEPRGGTAYYRTSAEQKV